MTIREIHPNDEPDPAPLGTPTTIDVELECPSCHDRSMVEARLQTRVTRDQDGKGNTLALRVRAAKVSHTCGQGRLGLAEGPRER